MLMAYWKKQNERLCLFWSNLILVVFTDYSTNRSRKWTFWNSPQRQYDLQDWCLWKLLIHRIWVIQVNKKSYYPKGLIWYVNSSVTIGHQSRQNYIRIVEFHRVHTDRPVCRSGNILWSHATPPTLARKRGLWQVTVYCISIQDGCLNDDGMRLTSWPLSTHCRAWCCVLFLLPPSANFTVSASFQPA